MKLKKIAIILTLLLTCLVLMPLVSSATISFEPTETTITQGGTTNFTLFLDSAPDGLAGYNLNIVLSNPGVARIAGVSFPSWATLNNVSYPSSGVVRLSGVDLGKAIQPGAGPVELGTVTIQGVNAGPVTVSVDAVRMAAQGGSNITPVLNSALLTIQGGASSGGGGNSGGGGSSYTGGGGGAYSGGSVETDYTSGSVSGGNSSAAGTTAGTVQTAMTQETTPAIQTTPVSSLPTATTPAVPVVKSSVASPVPIPWLTILEIFLALGLISAAIVLYLVIRAKLI